MTIGNIKGTGVLRNLLFVSHPKHLLFQTGTDVLFNLDAINLAPLQEHPSMFLVHAILETIHQWLLQRPGGQMNQVHQRRGIKLLLPKNEAEQVRIRLNDGQAAIGKILRPGCFNQERAGDVFSAENRVRCRTLLVVQTMGYDNDSYKNGPFAPDLFVTPKCEPLSLPPGSPLARKGPPDRSAVWVGACDPPGRDQNG